MKLLEAVIYRGPYRAPSLFNARFAPAKSQRFGIACLVGVYVVAAVLVGSVASAGQISFNARPNPFSEVVEIDDTPVETLSIAEPEEPTQTESANTPEGKSSGLYSYGQCTYYVASKRYVPDGWGDASGWMGSAKAAGYKTGTEPKPGAIAWTSGGWSGHVAYVEQVDGGRVYISEMNYEGWNQVSHRWVGANEFEYIY